jgi:photosystem II stability/assembly factor-like uncharacterized protein
MNPTRVLLAIIVAATLSAPSLRAQSIATFDERLVSAFTYRNLGPFRMGARTSDIAVPDAPAKDHLYTFYVGFWTGGLWKTTNNGTTFEPVFDGQMKLAIGDVAIAPSNPDVVWVGTGDAFTSRSSYAGDGVYRSTDAGKTWTNMGLKDTHHIARIVIHPTNPDIVYVAAMGALYSENEGRGVYRTTDAGLTWEKVLYINEKIGIIDLALNPQNPDILYAAAYDKVRLPWQMVNGGPASAIYRTSDGGRKWTRLTNGLPTGRIGRIGLDIYPKNPDIVYAVIENDNPRPATADAAARGGVGSGAGGAGQRVDIIGGELYRTTNGGQTWTKMNPDTVNVMPKGPYYFTQVRVYPDDPDRVILTGEPFLRSNDGGRTWPDRIFPRMFGDFRTLWIDPADSDRIIIGSDGGVAISYDGGDTSDHLASIPVGEIYSIGVDNEEPYNIYGGLQDHEHWRGPSHGPNARGTSVFDWLAIGDNDGIMTQVDPSDSRWVYTTRQYGAHTRVDQKLGYETNIPPRAQPEQPPLRFQWITPIHISPHDPATIYAGSQFLHRSRDRGDTWNTISPDLSTNPADRILPESETRVPGGIPWFAITSISESPLSRDLIWAGTSDGKVHMTRNGGGEWTDLTAQLTAVGAREDAYVSRVRASQHVAGRAYVAKNGYRFDDFRPFLYRTDDFGATWRSIGSGLPDEPINVVFEDHRNPDLLFVGNDTGVFVSIDGGAHWVKMNNNMPNIPVHDLLVHPRDNDLVLGTYGRGFWITNIAPLQQLAADVLAADVHMFEIAPTVQRVNWVFGANDYLFGQRYFQTPNPPNGMVIRYYLKTGASSPANVVITNAAGAEVARLEGTTEAGINTVVWNTRNAPPGDGRGRGRSPSPGRGGPPIVDLLAPLGDYTVTLEVAGRRLTRPAKIAKTQGWTLGGGPVIIRP